MDTPQPPQQLTSRVTRPTLRPLELLQAQVHSSTVAATEAAERFEVLVPAVEAVVAGSKVDIGARGAMAPGLLPVNQTIQAQAAEHHKPPTLASHRHITTVRILHKMPRIHSDHLRSCK